MAIENRLGHNLTQNFPVIDRFVDGVATSIKSLDLGAKTYQNTRTLQTTCERYIDKVAGFNGRNWGRHNITQEDISGRALDLVIPSGGTQGQLNVLEELIEYGQSRGVTVNLLEMPR